MRNGTTSPAPRNAVHTNTPIASSMPASQVRARPQRATARSHSGMDSA
eukprot:gene19062-27000_t